MAGLIALLAVAGPPTAWPVQADRVRDGGTADGIPSARAGDTIPTGAAHGTLPAGLPPGVRACAGCHLNPGLRASYRDSTGAVHSQYIDPRAYVASIHYRQGKRECTACHAGDYSTYPHPGAAGSGEAASAEPSCLGCHQEFGDEYRAIQAAAHASIHFAADASVDFDCGTCHSPHTMRPAREMTVAEKNAPCVACHEQRFNPSGLTLAQRHAWHPQAALHLSRIACIDCHTRPAGADFSFRHAILPKEQATRDCYACHGADSKMASYVGSFVAGRPHRYTRSELVGEYYLSGGTRYPLLDASGLLLLLAVALGTGAHGLLRWLGARRRDAPGEGPRGHAAAGAGTEEASSRGAVEAAGRETS